MGRGTLGAAAAAALVAGYACARPAEARQSDWEWVDGFSGGLLSQLLAAGSPPPSTRKRPPALDVASDGQLPPRRRVSPREKKPAGLSIVSDDAPMEEEEEEEGGWAPQQPEVPEPALENAAFLHMHAPTRWKVRIENRGAPDAGAPEGRWRLFLEGDDGCTASPAAAAPGSKPNGGGADGEGGLGTTTKARAAAPQPNKKQRSANVDGHHAQAEAKPTASASAAAPAPPAAAAGYSTEFKYKPIDMMIQRQFSGEPTQRQVASAAGSTAAPPLQHWRAVDCGGKGKGKGSSSKAKARQEPLPPPNEFVWETDTVGAHKAAHSNR
jgi:hypothetical protein